MAPLLVWWLLIELLSLAALPLTLALLKNLPDRGYPFARVIGILLPSFLAWFLGMAQLASYGQGAAVFGVLVLASLSALMGRGVLPWLRQHWRLVLGYELLFAAALFCGTLLRIYAPWGGPAIGHTEQPMDFAFLNGILQSRTLPPQDPWLSSATSAYFINYYYLGYFMAASLTLLSGLPAAVTFNLNLALILALAVTGCFSLGYNLTLAMDARRLWRGVAVGALAAVLVLLVGNQVGALQLLAGSNQMAPLDAGETWTVLRARLAGESGPVPLEHRVRTSDFGGGFDTVQPTAGRQIQDFDWWWPSRALWDDRPTRAAYEQVRDADLIGAAFFNWRSYVSPDEIERSYAITEFPFFSFYLGDMHPHVMSIPLTLLAIALALHLVLAPQPGLAALGEGYRSWLFLAVNALILGGLWMANSWDLPTYLLLYGAAWIWRWRKDAPAPSTRRERLTLLRDLAALAGLCFLLYLPFHLTFRSLVGGRAIPEEVQQVPVVGWLVGLPGVSRFFQAVGVVFLDRTPTFTLIVVFGLFLVPLVAWLGVHGIEERRAVGRWRWVVLGATLVVALILALLGNFPLLLAGPLLGLAWVLLRPSRPAEAMVLLMLLLACVLLLGCDVFYIRDIWDNRMNTIFKFYFQVWIILGVAAAWAVGDLTRDLRRLPRLVALPLWGLPALLLLAGALVYPLLSLNAAFGPTLQEREVLGLRLRLPTLARREWTLDGLTTMRKQYPGDYAGVQWILENAPPDAVVLEAFGPEWGYHGRVSASTGRPTLLGWDGHEAQWRGGQPEAAAEIAPRRQAVQTIYETTDLEQARRLLEQYRVRYVFVGSLEASYPAEGLAKFARLGTLVFEAPGVQVYEIPR